MTSRTKLIVGLAAAAAVAAAAALALPRGGGIGGAIADIVAPDPICPLTGLRASGEEVPARPVLAVKIENSPDARPQVGLNAADIVYEEPVEGGITRFIAIFQCSDVDRLGPIRSARTTDPEVLVQYGTPLIAYSGAAGQVIRLVADAGLIDVNYSKVSGPYTRDDSRVAPHNLFSSTSGLWGAADWTAEAPEPVFSYDEEMPEAPAEKPWKVAVRVHLDFSSSSDVYWRWNASESMWERSHGDTPHLLEDGSVVSAATVIVQVVEVHDGTIIDAAGNPSPEVTLVGTGVAYVFRDGQVIKGTWVRDSLDEVTRFLTPDGEEIPMVPGRTWVELLPSYVDVEFARK